MPKYSHLELSIVIPALREEKRIGGTLDELSKFLKTDKLMKTLDVEVIVVAADSTDATHKIAISKKDLFRSFTLLKPGKPVGKGRDVQFGMQRAHGNIIVFMDADLATPLVHLPVFYNICKSGTDVVIATRNLRKHHESVLRRLLSNSGNLLFRIASGVWVEDSQCGFKMFSKKANKTCFSGLTIMGWGFDMEVLAIARANKLKIKTKRINDWVSVPGSTFTGGFTANALSSLKELGYIFINRIKRTYVAN